MRIVIVDDNIVNLELVTHLARKLDDCEPIPFQNPLAALLWCTENDVDVAIVDFMMPEIDGIAFIRSFRRQRRPAASHRRHRILGAAEEHDGAAAPPASPGGSRGAPGARSRQGHRGDRSP
jgi:CheY-like chemotaxis protein